MIQAHIIYSGAVQGVGFRYTVQRAAATFHCNGWVKNLANGSVEICAEGSNEDLKGLCQNIEEHFDGYIHNKDIQFNSTLQNFKNFQITY